ncbi:hypothetical protein AT984_04305 [Paucibacter sp. KCTC 42545]|nr:hypothetical protein AT984_04305 [Paucibacter sp. KCTC 42545]
MYDIKKFFRVFIASGLNCVQYLGFKFIDFSWIGRFCCVVNFDATEYPTLFVASYQFINRMKYCRVILLIENRILQAFCR